MVSGVGFQVSGFRFQVSGSVEKLCLPAVQKDPRCEARDGRRAQAYVVSTLERDGRAHTLTEIEQAFDPMNRLVRRKAAVVAGDAGTDHVEEIWEYDLLSRVVRHMKPWGGPTLREYDGLGRVLTESSGAGQTHRTTACPE